MEFFDALALRRSTRDFTPEKLNKKQIEEILKAGCAAPCGRGRFSELHMTVVEDSEALRLATQAAREFTGKPDYEPFYGAQTVIFLSCTGTDLYTSAACVLETMHLAAANMGLGSLYLAGVCAAVRKSPEALESLKLPQGYVLADGLAVGYAREPLKARSLGLDKISISYL